MMVGTCHLKVSPVTVAGFLLWASSRLLRRAAPNGTFPASEKVLKWIESCFAPYSLTGVPLLGKKFLKADELLAPGPEVVVALGLKPKPELFIWGLYVSLIYWRTLANGKCERFRKS